MNLDNETRAVLLDLGNRIKAVRLRRGMSMEECARRAGWVDADGTGRKANWSRLESGAASDQGMTVGVLLVVSKILRVSPSTLLKREIESTSTTTGEAGVVQKAS